MEKESQIEEIVSKIVEEYRKKIEDADAIATGKLHDFDYKWELDDGHFVLYYLLPEYWKYASENTYDNSRLAEYPSGKKKPPYPMVEALKEWIEVKGLPYNAWAVATDIANNGWKDEPKRLLEKSLDDSDKYIDELEDLLVDDIDRWLWESIALDKNEVDTTLIDTKYYK